LLVLAPWRFRWALRDLEHAMGPSDALLPMPVIDFRLRRIPCSWLTVPLLHMCLMVLDWCAILSALVLLAIQRKWPDQMCKRIYGKQLLDIKLDTGTYSKELNNEMLHCSAQVAVLGETREAMRGIGRYVHKRSVSLNRATRVLLVFRLILAVFRFVLMVIGRALLLPRQGFKLAPHAQFLADLCCATTLQPVSSRTEITAYHGTTCANAQKIKLTGFRPSTNGMLGAGVYFSQDLAKAQRYGGLSGRILQLRIQVGDVIRIDHKGHHRKHTWHHDHDTAWVPPHCHMVASELEEGCVANPRRITLLHQWPNEPTCGLLLAICMVIGVDILNLARAIVHLPHRLQRRIG